MSFESHFPIWAQLQPHQQRLLLDSLTFQTVKKVSSCEAEVPIAQGLY